MYYSDLGYESYEQYLASKHWQKLREKRVPVGKSKCRVCGDKRNLVLHHRTYENLGNEKKQDTVVLCSACNSKVHFYDNGKRVPLTFEKLYAREKEIASLWYKLKHVRPSQVLSLFAKAYSL